MLKGRKGSLMKKAIRVMALILCLSMVLQLLGCKKKSSEKTEAQLQDTFMPEDLTITEEDVVYEDSTLYVDSQILLTVKNDTPYKTVEKMIHEEAGEIIGFISFSGDYHVDFPDGKEYGELNSLAQKWMQIEFVEAVSLNRVYRLSASSVDYGNDPWINTANSDAKQDTNWDEANPGGNNWWAEAIRMPTVWGMDIWDSNNTSRIKLGLIDSAFDTTNQDLAGVFIDAWQNDNSIPMEIREHGTHVAGLMAAQIGNGCGIAGVASCAHPTLYGFATKGVKSEIYCGMMHYKYAITLMLEQDVRVINISQALADPIVFAAQQGNQSARNLVAQIDEELEIFLKKALSVGYDFLIVKGAGNTSNESFVSCPITKDSPYGYRRADTKNGETGVCTVCSAKYGMFTGISDPEIGAHIITVGAAEPNGWSRFWRGTGYTRAAFSNIDCDLYAPGVDILSTVPGGVTTGKKEGTSMATPIVSGAAGLVWSVNPDLSSKQVKDILIVSASYKAIEGGTDFVDDEVTIIDVAYAVNLALALKGNSDSVEGTNGVLMGSVYTESIDSNGEKQIKGIPNAQIKIATGNGKEVMGELCSDELGGFTVFLPEGEYRISIEAESYERYESVVALANGSVEYLSALMEPSDLSNLVTDAYSKECKYAEERYNSETRQREKTGKIITHTYHIPQINISSSDAERINNEIYSSLYPVIENVVSEIEENILPFSSEEISYRWAVNGDILSLVVLNYSSIAFGGGAEYMVYNLSASTGTTVSNEAVVSSVGMSEEEFIAKAQQVLETSFRECWSPYDEEYDDEKFVNFFYEQLEKTVSKENIKQSYPYINENGQLCIIARQYTMVADYYWGDYNMVDFVPSP